MGCSNEADTATLSSAREPGDATTTVSADQVPLATLIASIVASAGPGFFGEAAIRALREEGGAIPPSLRSDVGFVAERAIARYNEANGGIQVFGHEGDQGAGEKGIDGVLIDKGGRLIVQEVKSTGRLSATLGDGNLASPKLSMTEDGKQESERWIESRLAEVGLDDVRGSDVFRQAVVVDVLSGRAQIFTVSGSDANTVERLGDPFSIEDYLWD